MGHKTNAAGSIAGNPADPRAAALIQIKPEGADGGRLAT
jgi:hypothetical protein